MFMSLWWDLDICSLMTFYFDEWVFEPQFLVTSICQVFNKLHVAESCMCVFSWCLNVVLSSLCSTWTNCVFQVNEERICRVPRFPQFIFNTMKVMVRHFPQAKSMVELVFRILCISLIMKNKRESSGQVGSGDFCGSHGVCVRDVLSYFCESCVPHREESSFGPRDG